MASATELSRLGIQQAQQRNFRQAAEYFRQAVSADPSSANSHVNLGNVLAELGDFAAAKASYQRALILEPQSVDLHFNFGVMLIRLEDHAAAALAYQRAAKLAPNFAAAHSKLGLALARCQRHVEAIPAFRRAISLDPRDAEALSNLGTALTQTGDYDQGLQCYVEALRLQPNYPEAHCNYAIGLMEAGRLEESLAHFSAALKLRPDYHDALLSHAVALLLKGDYQNGWREYDRRIKDKSLVRVTHSKPIWDGSPLAGRTLLLEAEQGMGDTIQFVRYAQEIKRTHEGRVIVAVEPSLVPLLTGIAGADLLIGQNEPRPPFDLWAPLLSLPGIFKHDPTTFPAPVPYLKAELARTEKWKAHLADVPGFKVGIAWQGSKQNRSDRRRSFPVAALAPIAQVSGVTLISLQKGEGNDQLAGLTDFQVLTLGDDFDASGGAFLDTAAVMQNLDLVISADTSICHLAGALNVPVWLALAFVPDWRWTMQGDRTPWYPSMRLFRQKQLGQWASVFEEMASAMNEEINRSGARQRS